jgi:hypothetical protein
MKKFSLAAVGLILALGATQSTASDRDTLEQLQSARITLQKEIETLQRDIVRTDSLKALEGTRSKKQQADLQLCIDKKQSERADIERQREEVQQQITALSAQVQQMQTQRSALANQRQFLSGLLIEKCSLLQQHINSSLPWNNEQRLGRISALKNDLQAGTASIEDGFARLRSIIDEEISFGDDVVLEERQVRRNNGTTLSARMMRLGALWMVYVDTPEENYGVLYRSTTGEWIWREELSFAEREAIRTAIRVKEAKRPPQLVVLPLSLSIGQKGGPSND